MRKGRLTRRPFAGATTTISILWLVLVIVEAERARVVPAAHALHTQQLLVRLAADGECDEIVAARDDGRLPAASTTEPAEATAATTALLAGRTKQLLEFLRAAGERIERIQRILSARALGRSPLTTAARTGGADDRALTRARVPRATGTRAAAAAAPSEQPREV